VKHVMAYETWLGWSQVGRVREGCLEGTHIHDCEREISPNRQMQLLWICLMHASAVIRTC
jgi:hypothetical protein